MMAMVMMVMVTKRFSIIILSKVEAHLVGPLGKISMAIMAMMIKMTMTMVMTMMVLLTKRLSIIIL